MSKNRKIIVFIYRGLFSNARPRPKGERTLKETKRLYLALLVLAVGFFWCMCAGLFWPAQAAEDPEKGAREAVHAAVAAEGGRDWDAFLDLQCAAARGRWGTQIRAP